MFRGLGWRHKQPVKYSFFVCEDGRYVDVEKHEGDRDGRCASPTVEPACDSAALERPASLDEPNLRMTRKQGLHILTLDIPEEAVRSIAA